MTKGGALLIRLSARVISHSAFSYPKCASRCEHIYDTEGPNIALTFREGSDQVKGRYKSYWLFIEQVIVT